MDKSKELPLRILSILVLYPLVVYLISQGQWPTLLLIAVIGLLAMIEWFRLILQTKSLPKAVSFLLIGNAYIFIGCFLFWFLSTKIPWPHLVIILTLTFLSDIGGFVVGSTLDGPKLVPSISPNKTWSGALGSILFTLIGGYLFKVQTYLDVSSLQILLSWPFLLILSMVAQLGDLLESWTKRVFWVKDSSRLIPGHGGILDRIDSVLAVIYLASLTWIFTGL